MSTNVVETPAAPAAPAALTRKDFATPHDVRWCPGCGDYAILAAMQRAFAEMGVPREKFVVVSGIGCSSRFPYYMNTYGFHSIHGRAPAVATGVKLANPDLAVWVITGDGDGLSIGGNHLLHMLRRNVGVKVVLFNNRIYGLTKGQYSPTSPLGTRTKTTPGGSIDNPIKPLRFALSAEATFIARTLDNNVNHMVEVFKAAHAHRGGAFIEVLQNCVIFNDKTWDPVYSKEARDENLLFLEENKPLLFGRDKRKGITLKRRVRPEVVAIGEDGITETDMLVHRPRDPDMLYASLLAQMSYPRHPMVVGVLRSIDMPTYEELVHKDIDAQTAAAGPGDIQALLNGEQNWRVE